MLRRLLNAFRNQSRTKQKKPARPVRLQLEALERREVMTVTPHSGAVLPNVEIQALYYGSDWSSSFANAIQVSYLDGFLKNLVNSSYMDSLSKAGYGVGHGTVDASVMDPVIINKGYFLTDAQIAQDVRFAVWNGAVPNHTGVALNKPNANTLYVVFVEANVAVKDSAGQTSQANFAAYHSTMYSYDAFQGGTATFINYAVVTVPGGTVGNASAEPFLAPLNEMTVAASHEIAEAITDPHTINGFQAWYDNALGPNNGEVGDITNGSTVWLNGYAVQRISDQYDNAMTPAGTTSATKETFVLQTDGFLWEHDANGWTFLNSNVTSISDQGIDTQGQAMIDVVFANQAAYEYHQARGWTYLAANVQSAQAGQGVSYYLGTDGQVWEYSDTTGGTTWVYNRATSISAGTDKTGVNTVDITFNWGDAYAHSDSTGFRYLNSSIRSVSAGQQGNATMVSFSGLAFLNQADGSTVFLGSNVQQVTAGVDQYGQLMIDLLYTNGVLYERTGGFIFTPVWTYLDSNVTSISKANSGQVDLVFSWGDSYEHAANGNWNRLTGSSRQAT